VQAAVVLQNFGAGLIEGSAQAIGFVRFLPLAFVAFVPKARQPHFWSWEPHSMLFRVFLLMAALNGSADASAPDQ